MEIVFIKTGKRGRPAKMAKFEDGHQIPYKEFMASSKAQKAKVVVVETTDVVV